MFYKFDRNDIAFAAINSLFGYYIENKGCIEELE